ncbi:MAG: uracil-DNA glycosylase [Spirochaetales bacterium]|nr:uracil-DNA glycosylase [Spirochaetales bacterium]
MKGGSQMDNEWVLFIENEKKKPYFTKLLSFIENERKKTTVFPKDEDVFNAFKITPLKDIKCVIIGQDPYFNPNEAHGLAFSVKKGVKIPPSLRNIFIEIESDLGIKCSNTDLTGWAKQGVFLINRVLTVRSGEPNSHKDCGWEEFTNSVITFISKKNTGCVFMLWGNEARKLKKSINVQHLILEAPHPSPLSSYRGFFGCRHFSSCNSFLTSIGKDGINWEN